MCTRAALTGRIIWMVRASSPSSARSRVTSCMNEVRPSEPSLSNSSLPTAPPRGRPFSARIMRAVAAWPAGTSTIVLSALTSNGTPASRSAAPMARDVVAVEAGIERLHGRPAEHVAGEAGDAGDREPDQRERDETPDAQTEKVRPESFRLRQEVRHAHARLRELAGHARGGSLRRDCARTSQFDEVGARLTGR